MVIYAAHRCAAAAGPHADRRVVFTVTNTSQISKTHGDRMRDIKEFKKSGIWFLSFTEVTNQLNNDKRTTQRMRGVNSYVKR